MLFGITGAHRSGKSTLAKAVAEELSIEYYATSTFEVAQKIGIDPMASMTLRQRVELQLHLVESHVEALERLPRPLIVDRTPLDYLGYLTAEFAMGSEKVADEDTMGAASRFRALCIDMTRQYYDCLFYVCPLESYEAKANKPGDNPVFQSHLDLLVLGGIASMRSSINSVLIFDTDFETRRECVHDMIVKRMDQIDTERRTATYLQ